MAVVLSDVTRVEMSVFLFESFRPTGGRDIQAIHLTRASQASLYQYHYDFIWCSPALQLASKYNQSVIIVFHSSPSRQVQAGIRRQRVAMYSLKWSMMVTV